MNVQFYVPTPRKSLLILVVPKTPEMTHVGPKKCTVSLSERQFATLYLPISRMYGGGGVENAASQSLGGCGL